MSARCRRRAWVCAALLLALLPGVSACSTDPGEPVAEAPRCSETERVALLAQSVPSSSYIPCVADLPPGWSSTELDVHNGQTSFSLESDRSAGHPVDVAMTPSCEFGSATPIAPRTPGGRTYLELERIDPRYQGTMYDVFPGGCVSYRFNFERDAHIPLMAQLQETVGFVSRQQLRIDVADEFGVQLDP